MLRSKRSRSESRSGRSRTQPNPRRRSNPATRSRRSFRPANARLRLPGASRSSAVECPPLLGPEQEAAAVGAPCGDESAAARVNHSMSPLGRSLLWMTSRCGQGTSRTVRGILVGEEPHRVQRHAERAARDVPVSAGSAPSAPGMGAASALPCERISDDHSMPVPLVCGVGVTRSEGNARARRAARRGLEPIGRPLGEAPHHDLLEHRRNRRAPPGHRVRCFGHVRGEHLLRRVPVNGGRPLSISYAITPTA